MGKFTIEITDDNFEEVVVKAGTPVLVDFWAEWCGPCLAIAPTLDELGQEYDGKFIIGKLNVDMNPKICEKFGIMKIPTLLFFDKGELADKHVGGANKPTLKAKIEKML